jgi:putative toxin-antitoxin system antitoxin component (TIGR02293 family)
MTAPAVRDIRPDDRKVLKVLGLRRGVGSLDLVEALRRGLPSSAFGRVADLAGVSREEAIRVLRIGRASVFRKVASKRPLAPDESQKVARLARITLLAEYVLEDPQRGRAWLTEPVPALGGQRPIELLDTDEGARTVEETLLRLEYGILA